jgi:hypothetical protein
MIDGHPEELTVSVETACPGEPANAQTARDGGAAECTFFLGNAAEVLVPEPTAAGIVLAAFRCIEESDELRYWHWRSELLPQAGGLFVGSGIIPATRSLCFPGRCGLAAQLP